MTEGELITLLGEIRNGRPESDSLEWKRQWPDLKTEDGKNEFRKDIASLANSAAGTGVLLYGLKDASLFPADLPVDEAVLQQILLAITPVPHAQFERLTVEGTPVTVVSINGPFDRPYVAKLGSQNSVFVRKGSSISTANRYDLDSFYSARVASPVIRVNWRHWRPGAPQFTKGDSQHGTTLPLFEPVLRMNDIEPHFLKRLESIRRSYARDGYPTSEQIDKFAQDIRPFLDSLSELSNLRYWYATRFEPFAHGTLFSIEFRNSGVRPATELKAELRFPDWILLMDKLMDKSRKAPPEGYVRPPFVPPHPRPQPEHQAKRSQRDYMTELMRGPGLSPTHYAQIPVVRETSGGYLGKKDRSKVTFWADRLLHTQSLRAHESILAVTLPTAPVIAEPAVIPGQVFCAEQQTWQQLTLQIALIARQ